MHPASSSASDLSSTTEALLRLHIAGADSWGVKQNASGNTFYPIATSGASVGMPPVPKDGYTVAEMGLVDARLPAVLNAMVSTVSYGWRGKALRLTLRHWNEETLQLEGTLFGVPDFTFLVIPDELEVGIKRDARDGSTALIASFNSFNLRTCGIGIRYIATTNPHRFNVNKTYLRETKGDFDKLIIIGEGLALSEAEFARMLLLDPYETVCAELTEDQVLPGDVTDVGTLELKHG